jgi:hypothetical protein
MTVASYERDPGNQPGVSSLSCPKIIASTTPATFAPTRPKTAPRPQNTRSSNGPEKALDIPTSFIMRTATRSETCGVREPRVMGLVWCARCAVLEQSLAPCKEVNVGGADGWASSRVHCRVRFASGSAELLVSSSRQRWLLMSAKFQSLKIVR